MNDNQSLRRLPDDIPTIESENRIPPSEKFRDTLRSRGLRPKQQCEYLGFSRTTLWQLEQTDPDFPMPIELSPRCKIRLKEELDAWLDKKAKARVGTSP